LSAWRRSYRVDLSRVIRDVRNKYLYMVSGIARRHVIKALTKCRLATLFCFENLVCRRPVLLNVVR
jgi:hypothetical protein